MSSELATRGDTNPFAGFVQRTQAVAVEPDVARAVAEVQASMTIAKRFPRDQKLAIQRVLDACTRPSLAQRALYSYSRGGSDVTGPSIRLAEAIAQHWGNLQFGLRELEQRDGESTVEAYAWDVESNTRRSIVFTVQHVRDTRKGRTKLTDSRDIYEMFANQGARRLRACLLAVIPGDVVEDAVAQVERTMRETEQVTPERIATMLDAFSEHGVTKAMIERRIQRNIDAMTPALMANMRKIYNSLKDGMSEAGDWFDADPVPEVTKKPTSPPPVTPAATPAANSAAPDGIDADKAEIDAVLKKFDAGKRKAFTKYVTNHFKVPLIDACPDAAVVAQILAAAYEWASPEGQG